MSVLGLIAGSGPLPFEVAEAASELGLGVAIAAIERNTDPAIESRARGAFGWFAAGELERVIRFFRDAAASEVILAGAVTKRELLQDPASLRPDARAIALLRRLPALGDDALLRAIADELESEGLPVVDSTKYLGDRLVREGLLVGGPLSAEQEQDLALGLAVAKSLGSHDVGQGVVVRAGAVVAVEAAEGTDAMVRRAAELAGPGSVVIKVAKPGQDLRFDVPVIGPGTVALAKEAGVAAIGLEAARTLVLERERTLALLADASITLVGLPSDSTVQAPSGEAREFERGTAPASRAEGAARSEAQAERRAGGARPLARRVPQGRRRDPQGGHPQGGLPRIAVVGAGHMGAFHAEKLAQLEREGVARLACVCDADPARAAEVAGKYDVRALREPERLRELADAACLAVPTTDHARVARELLEAGLDVLVEKPIATTREDARQLIDLAERRGRVLQVGHIERFSRAFAAIRPVLNRPHFIEAHRIGPYPDRATDVSVILDVMIHDLDIVASLAGAEVERVEAVGVPVLSSSEDIANARIRFANGCILNLTASRVSLESLRKVRLFQSDAYISIDFGENSLTIVRREGRPESGETPRIHAEKLELDSGDALLAQDRAFATSVRERTKPDVSGEDGYRALDLALRIEESIERLEETP